MERELTDLTHEELVKIARVVIARLDENDIADFIDEHESPQEIRELIAELEEDEDDE